MKRIILLICFLAFSSIQINAQVSDNRVDTYWAPRVVPVKQYRDSTWLSFVNKISDGTPWYTNGNAISTNTSAIGTTTNRSLRFIANNIQRAKCDSTGDWTFTRSVTSNSNIIAAGSATVGTILTCTNITGGPALSQSVVLTASTNSASSGTGIAFQVRGGNDGTVTAFSTLHNGSFSLPNNRSILGVISGTSGTNVTLLNWSSGDNIAIQGLQGSTDITINPTSTSRGLIVKSSGRLGVLGVASPGSAIHVGAFGSVSSLTAPFKLTVAGSTLMTTPESGAMEVNTSGALFWTPLTVRYQVGLNLTGSATLDFPSTLPGAVSDLTLTVTGASDGDVVSIGAPNTSVATGALFYCWVSATNVVTIRYFNTTASPVDPNSGTFKAVVNKN